MRSGGRSGYLSVAFYGILGFVLIAILMDFLGGLLPFGAGQISRNSEGILAIILVASWIQFARPRLRRSPWERPVTGATAATLLAMGLVLYHNGSWPSRVVTLNETLFALALVIPFIQSGRRSPRAALAISGTVLAIIVFGQSLALVTELAETLAILLLLPVGLDVIDRGILNPQSPAGRRARYGWYAFLIVTPPAFHFLEYVVESKGWIGDIAGYGVRLNEAFIFMLALESYFTLGHARTGPSTVIQPVRSNACVDASP